MAYSHDSSEGDAFDSRITQIELAMVRKPLNPEADIVDDYMSGYIQALFECGVITEIQKDFLHMRYAERLF
jgi:hypothetical protein